MWPKGAFLHHAPESIICSRNHRPFVGSRARGQEYSVLLLGAQGSLAQAVGSIIALRKLGEEYLKRFWLRGCRNHHEGRLCNQHPVPSDYAEAFAVVCMAPIVTFLSGAEVCYITTIDEAHKIPSKENNAASLRAARMMLNLLKDQESDFANSKAVRIEAEMVERETRAILERVIDLGDGDVAVGAVRR